MKHERHSKVNGSPIVARTCNFGENTIFVTEALVLSDVLKFAKVKGFKDVYVEGDSKLVIDSILNKYKMPWGLKTIIEDIKLLAHSFSSISWAHVFRVVNFLASITTSIVHSIHDTFNWDRSLPTIARNAHLFDCTESGCTRDFSF
ncbi:unnamed protein product [Malus baccata var. baccata]